MNTSLTVSRLEIPQFEDMTLFATNPGQMVEAQQRLILWCEQKIAVLDAERLEADGNAARAKASMWAGEQKRWKRVVGRARAKIMFYDKVKRALMAGYYIVPPFPGQVFAIRVKDDADPAYNVRPYHSHPRSSDHEQSEDTLPAGAGVWQNPFPAIVNRTNKRTDVAGKEIVERTSYADKWLPMQFPIGLARVEILEATREAMKAKFFDRLSILPKVRKPDPIVMGEINIPGPYTERMSFFVAWWLDTRALP